MSVPLGSHGNVLLDEVEKPIDYRYYFHLFKKNIAVVLTFLVIAITVSSIYASKLPSIYEATAQIVIEKPRTSWESSGVQEGSRLSNPSESWSEDYYATQQEMILGPSVLNRVIQQMKLKEYFETDNEDAVIVELKGMLSVYRVARSRIFNITATGNDPQFAANLVNTVAENFIRKNFEDSLYYNREILTWLSQGGQNKQKYISIQDPTGKIRKMKYKDFIETLPAIQTNPTLQALIDKKNKADAELRTQLRQFGEKHPVIVKARANIKFLNDSIDAEKRQVIESMKAKAEGQLQVQQGRIIEEAQIPKNPIGPDRRRIVLTASFVVFCLSLFIIFIIDHFDDTIHVMEDLERKGILIPFLGPLPLLTGKFLKDRKTNIVTKMNDELKTEMSEAFRYLRVAINFSAPPEALKLLVVTSCLPAEGKSFTATNIAVSLAQDGNKTLLIDADLRRPAVNRAFDLDNVSGLSNYLTGNISMDPVLKESFVENLSIITSGPVSPNPSEILGSERMKNLLAEAMKTFDRIIIDCPPLTGIGDGFVIGSLVGHIILVLSASKTPADLVRHTQQQLDKMGIRVLGMVLNKMDVEKERYGGYTKHYYHTYNKYYKGHSKKAH